MRDALESTLATQIIIVLTLIAVGFNIPVARQILGFVCISFVPGFLIARILRLNWKGGADTVVFSVALSVAFLMFVGVFLNVLHFAMGISEPLSTPPLTTAIGAVLLAMSLVAYRRDGRIDRSQAIPRASHLLRASLLIGLPLLAVLGAWLTNSSILLLMVAAIALVSILTIFSKKVIPVELHSLVLLVMAVSLLLHTQLTSRYLAGWDVFDEYYVFNLTKTNSFWSPSINGLNPSVYTVLFTYDSMLSVTILPAIYSSLLGTQGEWIFKIVYYLIFSLVPIALYQAYGGKFGKMTAFLAVFYFIVFPRFYGEERRQMIGELFYVLLILLMLREDIQPRKRLILSIVFAASLVVSHYSLSYIYLFLIAITYCCVTLAKSIHLDTARRKSITGSYVLLFFVICFSWYTFVSWSPSGELWGFINNVSSSFYVDFFNPEARGGIVPVPVTPGSSSSIIQEIDTVINKIPYLFIIVGLIDFFRNYKRKDFDWEYALMAAANALVLLMVLVVPNLGPAFEPSRFYHVTLFYLAPFCILGGIKSIDWGLKPLKNVARRRSVTSLAVCIFLVVIFLLKVGFIYEVAGDIPTSRSIGLTRMKTTENNETKVRFYDVYVPEEDVFGTVWLSTMAGNNSRIYADYMAALHVIRAYGMTMVDWEHTLANDTRIEGGGYIYLRLLNVQGLLRERSHRFGFSEISRVFHPFSGTNQIYSNGGSEVYQFIDRP